VDATSEVAYVERGKMVSGGYWGGVVDATESGISPVKTTVTGVTAFGEGFASWRGAYLSKQVSVTNMILIPMYWFKALLFGRDSSRF
jgi:NADH dehydrogenase/NADH:ubiquinone reductase (non-electrogenic)